MAGRFQTSAPILCRASNKGPGQEERRTKIGEMAESLAEKLFVLPLGDSTHTFEHDEKLPSLPVPSLRHTLNRYLDSVKPFVSNNELATTIRLVSEFEHGVGQKLQAKLMERAKHEQNWLEKWWEEIVYLSNRQALLPFSHMVGLAGPNKWETGDIINQIKNASLFCHFTSQLWLLLRQQRLRPDQSRDGKQHFSMHGFRRLFNCVRIPGETQDSLVEYFKTESEGSCPSHVIVLCNGYMFSLDALDAAGGLITPPEWEQQLLAIMEKSHRSIKGPGLPLLTCTNRTSWAKNRKHLEGLSVDNQWVLETVDKAMFVLTLDSEFAPTTTKSGQLALCGDLENRWTDKSLSSVFYRNGVNAGLCEHSAYDGMVNIVAMNYINLKFAEIGWKWQGSKAVRDLPEPQELCMKFDMHIAKELQNTASEIQANKSSVILVREKFTGYGKEQIQKFKVHPDSFIQMGLQLAYYKMHGRPAPTYETATTREFYHGRTETVRSCTAEAVQWIKAMLSSDTNDFIKRDLLKKAVIKHIQLMKEAKANAGCDRHLLGLYLTALEQGEEVPELFKDPAFTKSGGNGNFILSTSLAGYSPAGGGMAPMVRDGYGCFYNVCPDSLDFTVTVFRESPETSAIKYIQSLKQSFEDMKMIMKEMSSSNL